MHSDETVVSVTLHSIFFCFIKVDSSGKHVSEVDDVLKGFTVRIFSKMRFNSHKLPDKTCHTYTQLKLVNKFGNSTKSTQTMN